MTQEINQQEKNKFVIFVTIILSSEVLHVIHLLHVNQNSFVFTIFKTL